MRFSVAGHEIDYEVRGEGRPIILVHGVTGDRRVMEAAFDEALAGWQRVYLDLPGHGASRGKWEQSSADSFVDSLGALVHELRLQRPLAVGYSYGGYLVQGLAREIPLGGALLVCPVVEPDFGKRRVPLRRVVVAGEGLAFGEDPREREAFEEIAVVQTPAVLAAFQRSVHVGNVAADQDVVGAVRFRYAMARHYAAGLGTLERPVSILCARHDHWVGFDDAYELWRRLPDAELTVLPGCGHLLPFEAPQACREVIARWLERCRKHEPPG